MFVTQKARKNKSMTFFHSYKECFMVILRCTGAQVLAALLAPTHSDIARHTAKATHNALREVQHKVIAQHNSTVSNSTTSSDAGEPLTNMDDKKVE
jgi:hypothetical protein